MSLHVANVVRSILGVPDREMLIRAAEQLMVKNNDEEEYGRALISVNEAGDPRLICRYEYFTRSIPQLSQWVEEKLLPLVCECAGEPMLLFKDKMNNKHAGGGGYGPHQDIVAYKAFQPRYHVTAMVSIDHTTMENGCLQFANNYLDLADQDLSVVSDMLEGRPVLMHNWGTPSGHGDIRTDVASRLSWTPLTTSPSDIVMFDSFLPHKSAPNKSDGSRRAMFFTFAAAKHGDLYEQYYCAKRRNPHDPIFHVSTPTHRGESAGWGERSDAHP